MAWLLGLGWRGRHVLGVALGRRVDVRPGGGGGGPDVAHDLEAALVVEGAGAHHDEAGVRVAVAVDRRGALLAEVAAQGAAAARGGVVVLARGPLGDPELVARHHRVDAAAAAGVLLAVDAVAGAQAGDGGVDGVADGAAEAAALVGGGHGAILGTTSGRGKETAGWHPSGSRCRSGCRRTPRR